MLLTFLPMVAAQSETMTMLAPLNCFSCAREALELLGLPHLDLAVQNHDFRCPDSPRAECLPSQTIGKKCLFHHLSFRHHSEHHRSLSSLLSSII